MSRHIWMCLIPVVGLQSVGSSFSSELREVSAMLGSVHSL